MTKNDAWRWLNVGLVMILAGSVLLRQEDPFLLKMWGIAISMSGGVFALAGAGVLLRLWR
jgi:hypothetical protein